MRVLWLERTTVSCFEGAPPRAASLFGTRRWCRLHARAGSVKATSLRFNVRFKPLCADTWRHENNTTSSTCCLLPSGGNGRSRIQRPPPPLTFFPYFQHLFHVLFLPFYPTSCIQNYCSHGLFIHHPDSRGSSAPHLGDRSYSLQCSESEVPRPSWPPFQI